MCGRDEGLYLARQRLHMMVSIKIVMALTLRPVVMTSRCKIRGVMVGMVLLLLSTAMVMAMLMKPLQSLDLQQQAPFVLLMEIRSVFRSTQEATILKSPMK